MPEAPPVTMATLPTSAPINSSSTRPVRPPRDVAPTLIGRRRARRAGRGPRGAMPATGKRIGSATLSHVGARGARPSIEDRREAHPRRLPPGAPAHRDPHVRHRAGGDVLVRLSLFRAAPPDQRIPHRLVHRRVLVDRGGLDRRRPLAARGVQSLDVHRAPRRDPPDMARRPVVVRRPVGWCAHGPVPGPTSVSGAHHHARRWTSSRPCSWRRGAWGDCSDLS